MKKFSAVLICILLVVVLMIAPAYAAKPPKVGTNAIAVTVTVADDPNDTTSFNVTLSLDGKPIKSLSIAQGSPGTFTSLAAGTYTLTETPPTGYECSSTNPVVQVVEGRNNTYAVTFVNQKTAPPEPDPETIHYVALGDSIATGSTSRGTTTSYVYGYYNFLKQQYPDSVVALSNLSYNGDDATDLLNKLRDNSTFKTEVGKADVITITIGGNNILIAGENSFTSINNTVAEAGTQSFETDFPQVIDQIRGNLNDTAEIIIMTLYNPYNTVAISGYSSDPALHTEAEQYISRINAKIRVEAALNPETRFVEIHDYFKSTYADKGKMGSITYFYPISWLKFIRDPHPNQTGQNVIAAQHQ